MEILENLPWNFCEMKKCELLSQIEIVSNLSHVVAEVTLHLEMAVGCILRKISSIVFSLFQVKVYNVMWFFFKYV